jgi:NTE family protein
LQHECRRGFMAHRSRLRGIEVFDHLAPSKIEEFEQKLQLLNVSRGEVLIRAGDDATDLYIVVSGRFHVFPSGHSEHVAEIGPGQPIGEVAFFSGGRRTATVVAVRDSVVLVLTMKDFEEVAEHSPGVWRAVAATLARRLAERNAPRGDHERARPRTLTFCHAGTIPIADEFLRRLQSVFQAQSRCILVTSNLLENLGGCRLNAADPEATTLLNKLEDDHDYVIYVGDTTLTPWTEKAVRQADLIIWVGNSGQSGGSLCEPNEIERFASNSDRLGEQRIILLHRERGTISGTSCWLAERPKIKMHHHIAQCDIHDFKRFFRLIHGTSLGLVAGGGGALTAAHLGFYQALLESGLTFDIMGGTSGGAATTAALALGLNIDEMSRLIDDVFVAKKALGRWTWPRYSLLDHGVLDAALVENYTEIDVEDLWTPFFAVSTNLSRAMTYCHRTGPLWKAVRASSSIPALLPPIFTDDGEILVDGCLLDNVPIKGMRTLKSGPNVIVDVEVPRLARFDVNYAMIPSRAQLLKRWMNPFMRTGLPSAPGPGSVLLRSLMMNREDPADHATGDDVLLVLHLPEGFGHLEWSGHRRLRQIGYEFAAAELSRLRSAGHPVFASSS